jgi:hypothetical protein
LSDNASPGQWPDDLIPDVGPTDWPDLVGFLKARVPIRNAYLAFVPKQNGIGRPVSGGKEVFVRCPSPSHVDKRPSAWMQEREGLWYCAACGVGGDLFDMAAYATGYSVPGYKADAVSFGEVVQEVADRLGLTEADARAAGFVTESRPAEAADVSPEWPEDFTDAEMAEALILFEAWDEVGVPNAKDLAVRDVLAKRAVHDRSAEIAAEPEPELDEAISREIDIATAAMINPNTAELATDYDDALAKGLLLEVGCDPNFPHVHWEDVIPADTPIYRMLKALCVTDIPDEYFLWSIYTALGAMIGRRVELVNGRGAVDPALWTVIVGATGSSKSTVAVEMDHILSKVAPVKDGAGVKLLGVPASGEKFIEQLRREDVDTTQVVPTMVEFPNASNFMYSDEFSLLGQLLSRAGSTLASLLLQVYGLKRDYVLRPTESMSRISFPVTGPMLCILSTTQPNRISQMLSKFDVASGFMNRFVFASGKPRRVCVPLMGFGPDYKAVEAEFQLMENRLNCAGQWNHLNPMVEKAHIDKPWTLGPDAGGLARIRQWMHDETAALEGSDEYTADLLARRELVILKITLLMAFNRICAGDNWKYWTKEDVEAAIAHYPNIAHGWREMGAAVLDTEDSKLEDWIVDFIYSRPDGVSKRDLIGRVPKSMRKGAKPMTEVITAMSNSGIIREVELKSGNSGRGRKSVKWLYPPDASVDVDVESPESP